jgi:hypothetical protein
MQYQNILGDGSVMTHYVWRKELARMAHATVAHLACPSLPSSKTKKWHTHDHATPP